LYNNTPQFKDPGALPRVHSSEDLSPKRRGSVQQFLGNIFRRPSKDHLNVEENSVSPVLSASSRRSSALSFLGFKRSSHDVDHTSSPRKDRYKTLHKLGEGSEGVVKECIHIPSNRHVALKGIRKPSHGKGAEKDVGSEWEKETKLMKGIVHPHVNRLLDSFESPTKYYLAYEIYTGGELFFQLECKPETPVPEFIACREVYQALSAIHHLHAHHGIIHRDIKTPNFMVKDRNHGVWDEKVELALIDFGISVPFVPNVDENSMYKEMFGTPYYLAPEILASKGYGPKVDVWALGVIAFQLLSGVGAWGSYLDHEILFRKILTSTHGDMDGPLWKNISPEAKNFVRHCLTVDPVKRISSEEAMDHEWFRKGLGEHHLYMYRTIEAESVRRERRVAAAFAIGRDWDDVVDLHNDFPVQIYRPATPVDHSDHSDVEGDGHSPMIY
jgi:serine/threonine protein kinase